MINYDYLFEFIFGNWQILVDSVAQSAHMFVCVYSIYYELRTTQHRIRYTNSRPIKSIVKIFQRTHTHSRTIEKSRLASVYCFVLIKTINRTMGQMWRGCWESIYSAYCVWQETFAFNTIIVYVACHAYRPSKTQSVWIVVHSTTRLFTRQCLWQQTDEKKKKTPVRSSCFTYVQHTWRSACHRLTTSHVPVFDCCVVCDEPCSLIAQLRSHPIQSGDHLLLHINTMGSVYSCVAMCVCSFSVEIRTVCFTNNRRLFIWNKRMREGKSCASLWMNETMYVFTLSIQLSNTCAACVRGANENENAMR